MATGIRDRVVIAGMGCTRSASAGTCGSEDLMVEAFTEAVADAGIERRQIEAAWLGARSTTSTSATPPFRWRRHCACLQFP